MRFGLKIVAISAAVACANFMVAPILTEAGFSTVTEEATNQKRDYNHIRPSWQCSGCAKDKPMSDVFG